VQYLLHLLVLVEVFVVLAASYDLLAGQAGILSACHAAFYGVGAYVSALLAVHYQVPMPVGLAAGMAAAAAASLVVSLPALRLDDDYFVIATFGFQVIGFSVLNNWVGLTQGPFGIPGVPKPELFGWRVESRAGFALLGGALAAAAVGVVGRVGTSPFGRVLRAIREDEGFARSLGKNTFRFKATAFALSAALAAAAGSFYAHYASYIDPTNFTIHESLLVIGMVVIGGPDSRWGPPAGAAALILLPEAFRFVGLPGGAAANLRQVLYGAALIAVVWARPRGLAGRYDLSR
jgi:branched-chain amino acid transport system permease protein